MPLPVERFKEAYANWRENPFTGQSMAVDKTEDNLYIPASAPYTIQLLELPKKDDPSTVPGSSLPRPEAHGSDADG